MTHQGILHERLLSARTAGMGGVLAACLFAAGCMQRPAPALAVSSTPSPYQPTATFQELMDSVVDASGDYLWATVGTVADKHGVVERQPRTADDWHEFRRRAVVLAEAANLLVVPGRKVANGSRTVDDDGDLDTAAIQARLDKDPEALAGFAAGLRAVAVQLIQAADRRDVPAVIEQGGALDEVCEGCHKLFWYPDDRPPVVDIKMTPATGASPQKSSPKSGASR